MKIRISEPCFCNEIGQRTNNEDSIYPLPSMSSVADRLFLVCDGVGGHEGGEVASLQVAQSMAVYWRENSDKPDGWEKVCLALKQAADSLSQLENADDERAMGTTLTLLSIGESSVLLAHVGDSRIYLVRPGAGIVYKTKDHSLVQKWLDAGLITPEEACTHPKKNVITKAVMPGKAEISESDVTIIGDIREGDYFFLCTDGITESVDDITLVDILSGEESDREKMERIKNICREHSRDNYSAYLIPIHLEGADGQKEIKLEVDTEPILRDDLDLRNRRVEQEAEALLKNVTVAKPEKILSDKHKEAEWKEESRITTSGPREGFFEQKEKNRGMKTGLAYYIDYVCMWIKGMFCREKKNKKDDWQSYRRI